VSQSLAMKLSQVHMREHIRASGMRFWRRPSELAAGQHRSAVVHRVAAPSRGAADRSLQAGEWRQGGMTVFGRTFAQLRSAPFLRSIRRAMVEHGTATFDA